MLDNVPQADHHSELVADNCCAYDEFTAIKQDSCKWMMVIARDAHQQAFLAAAMLEEKIEQMSHSISCCHSSSH